MNGLNIFPMTQIDDLEFFDFQMREMLSVTFDAKH